MLSHHKHRAAAGNVGGGGVVGEQGTLTKLLIRPDGNGGIFDYSLNSNIVYNGGATPLPLTISDDYFGTGLDGFGPSLLTSDKTTYAQYDFTAIGTAWDDLLLGTGKVGTMTIEWLQKYNGNTTRYQMAPWLVDSYYQRTNPANTNLYFYAPANTYSYGSSHTTAIYNHIRYSKPYGSSNPWYRVEWWVHNGTTLYKRMTYEQSSTTNAPKFGNGKRLILFYLSNGLYDCFDGLYSEIRVSKGTRSVAYPTAPYTID